MTVPYTFSTATSAIPLSQLDSNFATAITLGNTAVYLGNTTTSLGNLTLTNATIVSLSAPISPAQGGTGLTTITANGLMVGNGTSNVTIISAGTTGNVLTSNGTAWLSQAATGQTYPGTGIPNSTGSAWGTSYSTTGSGTVVALATSPSFTTPVLGTPTSGNLSNCTADGTNAVGYLVIPQNAQTGSYTLVLADAGKHIYHASGAGAATYTIPAASSVAYPIGTAITFINLSSTSISIAITTDTMYLSSAGTTGTRTFAQYGSATAIKVSGLSSSGIWVISGSGLT
jgi:hypothetical protein